MIHFFCVIYIRSFVALFAQLLLGARTVSCVCARGGGGLLTVISCNTFAVLLFLSLFYAVCKSCVWKAWYYTVYDCRMQRECIYVST